MYDIENYYNAETIKEAVLLLKEHPDARIISGGSDVLIKIREGKMAGTSLVSIRDIKEIRGIRLMDSGDIFIGAATTFSHVTKDPVIQKLIPVLGEAVDQVGGPQVRNIGTIGGNTCNGVTSADSASTLFALDAIIELTGPEGIRRLPIREFYIKAGKVDIRQGELQTGILIPKQSYQGYRGHYIKYAMRNAMDIATLGCSANVKLSEDKTVIEDVRIAYGVAGPIPMRAVHAEEAGRGKEVSARILEEIAEQVLFDIHPRDSWRASKAFREHIARVLCQRALKEAIVRTGGVIHE